MDLSSMRSADDVHRYIKRWKDEARICRQEAISQNRSQVRKMLSKITIASVTALAGAGLATAKKCPPTPQGSAIVDLTQKTGEAKAIGSGFIYGWPDNGTEVDNSIPEDLVWPIGFVACRAGGAQLPAPATGWATGGYANYTGRFDSTLSNYRTTRKYGGDFILLPHDLWGADGGLDGLYPGDDDDWSETEKFLQQVISDLKENDMLEGLVFDLWNEPDIDSFWDRSWDQYLEYYIRAHEIVRYGLRPHSLSDTN
jgi:hypothetical protein